MEAVERVADLLVAEEANRLLARACRIAARTLRGPDRPGAV